jgi:NADH-ubiquinone oxidoreductase chain 5
MAALRYEKHFLLNLQNKGPNEVKLLTFCLIIIMLIVVTFVSSLVHIYSISYMFKDPHSPRFMCYLSVFTFFILMLVIEDNSIQLFLGWEGVGLAPYLLLNFWFTWL